MRKLIIGIVIGIFAIASYASTLSPYQGEQQRRIKALSSKVIEAYLAGKGMGFAKAAELNHYPGPRHVLDLAEQLAMSAEQENKTQALFDSMQAKAKTLGERLVEQERTLDQMFASGKVDNQNLKQQLLHIGELRARLRYVHLQAHLTQKSLLTKHQIIQYDQLRGYSANGAKHTGSVDHHH
ncbi:MAG: hypothetical protein OEX12_04920 [Gammaproteobacteria bacterium]|nr:hypothetical protein [Gammaproteobacteria bacterium]